MINGFKNHTRQSKKQVRWWRKWQRKFLRKIRQCCFKSFLNYTLHCLFQLQAFWFWLRVCESFVWSGKCWFTLFEKLCSHFYWTVSLMLSKKCEPCFSRCENQDFEKCHCAITLEHQSIRNHQQHLHKHISSSAK